MINKYMKCIIYIICTVLLLPGFPYGLYGGRYDQDILSATTRLLESRSEYKEVHAQVEDGIVTLTGTVRLESSRTGVEYKSVIFPMLLMCVMK